MIIFQSRYYRADLRANTHLTYVFGDNEGRYGLGGQAGEARNEPNAVGVATLKAPGVFWTDAERTRQCVVIQQDFEPLFKAVNEGRSIVLPLDGVGTGLARLEQSAPQTFAYLQKLWNLLIEKGSL